MCRLRQEPPAVRKNRSAMRIRTQAQKELHRLSELVRRRKAGIPPARGPVSSLQEMIDRFCSPEPNTGCWLFIGFLDSNGVGRVRFDGRSASAPRVAFFFAHCRWPKPAVLHHCDTPACFNPAHLSEGSQADNMRDMDRKGRRKTYSPRGESSGMSKLTESEVLAIRSSSETSAKLGRRFRVTTSAVCYVRKRKTWAWL